MDLYFWYDGHHYVSNMPPVSESGGLTSADDAVCMNICERGLAMFGIRDIGSDEIYHVHLEQKALEVGKFTVKVDFQPFVATKPAAKRRRRR